MYVACMYVYYVCCMHVCVCMDVWVYVCMHVFTYICVCMYLRMCLRSIYLHIYVRTYLRNIQCVFTHLHKPCLCLYTRPRAQRSSPPDVKVKVWEHTNGRRIKQEMRDFLTEEIRNQKHIKSKTKQYETYPDMHSLSHEFARAFHILH